MRRAGLVTAIAFACSLVPMSALAEGGDTDIGAHMGDHVGAQIRTQSPGSPGGQGGGTGQRPFHYEVTYTASTLGGCTDGRLQTVVRVWDDGSGRRDVVYAGCPRPDGDQPMPPTSEQVNDAVGIPNPTVGSNPTTKTLAGMRTYFWYDAPNTRAVTVQLNGFSVNASAKAVRFEWSMGDGTTYTTTEPGTPQDPAVEHAYRTRGPKTVTVAVTWQGAFTFTGPGDLNGQGDLGRQRFTGTRTYVVEEVQAVGET